MTIGTRFRSWQDSASNPPKHTSCSPNLRELSAALERRWHGWAVLGCYAARAVRGGTSRSSHAFGAAIDLSYASVGREVLDAEVIPYLVAWSGEWHLQAIHDYTACRIWHAARTPDVAQACDQWWRAQRPDAEGMGKSWATWIHLEVTREGWGDGVGELARGITPPGSA